MRPGNKLLATIFALTCSAGTQAITIDGGWADWITLNGVGSADDWIPNDPSVKYMVDDQSGGSGDYLNPGYGGQAFDAEAIYVKKDSLNIYVAVITGRNPDATGWRWGDIALDFGLDGTYEYGLVTRGDSEGIGLAGEIYQVDEWNVGIWDAPDDHNPNPTTDYANEHPTSIQAGTKLGNGGFAHSPMNAVVGVLGGDHYFMEASIPISILDAQYLTGPFMAHWTMGCANDWVEVDPPGGSVPVSGSLSLFGLGLLGMLGARRRQMM